MRMEYLCDHANQLNSRVVACEQEYDGIQVTPFK